MKSVRLTSEQFVEKAKAVHGDRYDYSETEYRTAKKDVKIICPEHGPFWQNPSNHRAGKGCRPCAYRERGNKGRKAADVFIEEAKSVHGSRYDYGSTRYTRQVDRVEIDCKEHGPFWMLPGNHIKGQGCPVCASIDFRSTMYTQKEFLQKARERHGDRYDYSRAEYRGGKRKVEIGCRAHGFFWQDASGHLSGRGCTLCATEAQTKNKDTFRISHPTKPYRGRAHTTEMFVEKARQVHGDKYDYSQVDYKNNHTKVEIICPKHGSVWQAPCAHLVGKGCQFCGRTGPAYFTREQFIERAIEVHGDRFLYDLVAYKSHREHVTITCKIHGDFTQRPSDHLSGCGCQRCPYRFADPCALYVMTSEVGAKIGISVDPAVREKRLNYYSPFRIRLHSFSTCQDWPAARAVEAAIHRDIAALNCGYTGFDGATEWFNIEPAEAIALVKRKAAEMDALV